MERLGKKNYITWCVRHYDNPCGRTTADFYADLSTLKHIKRLLVGKDPKREHKLLNLVITLCNCFTPEAAIKMLFFKVPEADWPAVKTILLFMGIMPDRIAGVGDKDIISTSISVDPELAMKLRQI